MVETIWVPNELFLFTIDVLKACRLVHTFELRHRLALGLIERRIDNFAVLQLDVGGVVIVLE